MTERINTPFTNEHFADWCLKMAEEKSPYWYGTCVYKATNSLLSSKSHEVDFNGAVQMNQTAAQIFRLLEEETTEEAIVDALVKEFDAPREIIAVDVHQYINALRQKNLLIE